LLSECGSWGYGAFLVPMSVIVLSLGFG